MRTKTSPDLASVRRGTVHPRTPLHRLTRLACALALGAALTGCAGMAPVEGIRLDSTTRVAVLSAFEPELVLLRQKLQEPQTHRVNGVDFHTGQLEGRPVVLFLSGISMTNASMNTQLVLDRFKVSHIVFSGIAGGVNPQLSIGDVTVPAQWGQYLEVLMARESAPGKFEKPPFITDATLPNFGMMFPRPVEFRSAAQPRMVRKFWFEVDPQMLAAAKNLRVDLSACAAGTCLKHPPKLVVGGNGVSGQAFMDNAAFREYSFKTFQANVLDMESAAVGMVAHSNGVPYLAFRSLSDLAGGGNEHANEMGTFMRLAADNSAQVLLAFLAQWKP